MDFNQNWPLTTFNSCDCNGRIQNIGGVLKCTSNEPAPAPAPYDTWEDQGWYGNTSSG
jgi:hypothetical protein